MKRVARRILTVAILFCMSRLSFAQTSDWTVVTQLFSGQKVKVETGDGKTHLGKVLSTSPDAIRLEKNQLIQKDEIQHILLWSPGHHGRNALIGLAVGAGIGVAFGAGCGGRDAIVSRGACMAVGAPFFGGIGAGVGALLPSRGRWHEVYRRD